jgi:hypothetical protein
MSCILCCIDIIFHASGKTSVPIARHRCDADALGGDEASVVDRSDDGNDSASTSTDDSGDGNDVDLFSNIAADDESDYGFVVTTGTRVLRPSSDIPCIPCFVLDFFALLPSVFADVLNHREASSR